MKSFQLHTILSNIIAYLKICISILFHVLEWRWRYEWEIHTTVETRDEDVINTMNEIHICIYSS